MTLEVTWRSGEKSVVTEVRPNQLYTIDEAGASGTADARPAAEPPIFEDVSKRLNHVHRENEFDDFERQPLLPNRLSRLGPGVTWHDLDGDEDDDLVEAPPAPQPIRGNSEPVELKQPRKAAPAERKPASEKTPAPAVEKPEGEAASASEPETEETGASGSAEVVSLDAFRKKN